MEGERTVALASTVMAITVTMTAIPTTILQLTSASIPGRRMGISDTRTMPDGLATRLRMASIPRCRTFPPHWRRDVRRGAPVEESALWRRPRH